MSYVHCHNCNWEQDDFWNRRYNPFRYFFFEDIPTWIRPRMIGTDPYMMPKPSSLAYRLGLAKVRMVPWSQPKEGPQYGFPEGVKPPKMLQENRLHTWYILGRSLSKWSRRLFTQKWWTYQSWSKACKRGEGNCPKCRQPLCID